MVKTLVILTVIVGCYAGILRPWLRKQAWAAGFFAWIEPFERVLYLKSESLLWARWLSALGVLLTTIAGIDPTMVQTIAQFLPEAYGKYAALAPLVITLAGFLGERLRRDTTKPLAVVAMPTDAPIEAKVAAAEAEHANAAAVAMIAKAA